MRNVLRLETKGCRGKNSGRVGGMEAWEGEGEGCLCDLPDMGGSEGEAMGNPQGNPRLPNEPRRDETR